MNEQQSNLYAIFLVDGEEYGAGVSEVIEIVEVSEITPVPHSKEYILGVYNLRGKIIPILDLEKIFKLKSDNKPNYKHFLISKIGDTLFGIRVEEVKEVIRIEQALIQTVPEVIKNKVSGPFLKGVAVFTRDEEKGISERVILLLDLTKVLAEENIKLVSNAQKGGTQV